MEYIQCRPGPLPQPRNTLRTPDMADGVKEAIDPFRPEHAMIPDTDDFPLQ